MRSSALRRTYVKLDPKKLARARVSLGTGTEAETLDRALDIALADAAIDKTLRRGRGKADLRKVFR